MLRMLSTMALCAALTAQEQVSPFRFVPADSCLVMRIGAPAKWQQHFAKTQVAKLFASASLAPMRQQATAAIDAGMEELRSSGKFDADLLQRLLSDYKGDIVMSLQVDFDALPAAMESGEAPPISMVIALSPDGSFDLAALGTAIEKAIEEASADSRPMRDLVVGDYKLRATSDDDDDMQATVPMVIDGHLVMLVSGDLEKCAAGLLGTADRYAGEADLRPFSMHARLDKAMATVIKIASTQMEAGGAPFDVVQMMNDLGVGALQSMSVSIGAEDKSVAGELRLALGEGQAGLFGTLMLDQPTPKLLRYLPAAAESFSVSGFDLGAAYRTATTIWQNLGDQVPMTWDDVQQQFTEATKVRLKEDLVDHVGTEMLMMGDVDAQMAAASEDNPAGALAGSCLGISLRNGKAFGESLEKALRARGLHAGRKSEDYLDGKIHRLNIGGVVELEYAVTDDLLLLAIGNDEPARQNLRAILDARKKPAEGNQLPAAATALTAAMPSGWSGISVSPIAQVLGGMGTMIGTLQEQMGEADADTQMITQMLASVAGDMKRLGIQTMVATSYTTARSLVSRFRW